MSVAVEETVNVQKQLPLLATVSFNYFTKVLVVLSKSLWWVTGDLGNGPLLAQLGSPFGGLFQLLIPMRLRNRSFLLLDDFLDFLEGAVTFAVDCSSPTKSSVKAFSSVICCSFTSVICHQILDLRRRLRRG